MSDSQEEKEKNGEVSEFPLETLAVVNQPPARRQTGGATLSGLLSDAPMDEEETLAGDLNTRDIPSDSVSKKPAAARFQHMSVDTDRYEFLKILGSGGMGLVRRVRDKLLNRTLAMKILHRRLSVHDGHVLRFMQEAQVVSQLQHPNILAIHDLGMLESGDLYFTMTEIDGNSLSHYIQQVHSARESLESAPSSESWNLHRLISAVHDVCKAVAYAHDQGVLHRDLKPDNIMVGPFGEVLVVDWGISKVLDDDTLVAPLVQTTRSTTETTHTLTGAIYGTPAYLAPELARVDGSQPTPQSDVYALGAILYETLRGQRPFEGMDVDTLLTRITSGTIEPFDTLSESTPRSGDSIEEERPMLYISAGGLPLPEFLVHTCQRAMSVDPKERFQSAREMVDLIGGWLDGSRKRETAMQLVHAARDYDRQILRAEREASVLRVNAKQVGMALEPWEPEEDKHSLWALKDRALALDAEAALMRVLQVQSLRAALAHKADLVEAHSALVEYYRAVHHTAENTGRSLEARRAEVILREHSEALPLSHPLRAELAKYLDGTGVMTLRTQPSGAQLSLSKFHQHHRRLRLGPFEVLGTAPIEESALPIGSFVVHITLDGYHPVSYPIFNQRCVEYSGVNPRGETAPIVLLPLGTLTEEDCYVPSGWCILGGDKETPNSLPKTKVWVPGFVMKKHPVTHEEYVVFLNALLAAGLEDAALIHAPKDSNSSDSDSSGLAYTRRPDGSFQLPEGNARKHFCLPRQPVTMISWHSARAYAAWYAEQTGQAWRLPMEFEWEKAARGVDGRAYPWGDLHDPSWSCMKDSHPEEVHIHTVDAFPVDESVYGVRGTAGNTRDWCLDRFRDDGPPLQDGHLLWPTEEDLADSGFKSTRGGSYGNSASRARSADRDWWFPDRSYVGRGFRLAWSVDRP